MGKEARAEALRAEMERLMGDFPESAKIDGMPELHQRAVVMVGGRPVDLAAVVAGIIMGAIGLLAFPSFAPWWVAVPSALILAVAFGISRNKEGDGLFIKKPKLRRKLNRMVPNRVRSGRVTPYQSRIIAVMNGRETNWSDLEQRINERTR